MTVGRPRKVYRRRTGPRGGYIKDAGQQPRGTETGSVAMTIDGGDPFCGWSEEPSRGWANPSFVGCREVRSIGYFVEAPAATDASGTES